ncbi:MAG: ABC transporter substrate-binding protein [Vicinamibacterales bacterium]
MTRLLKLVAVIAVVAAVAVLFRAWWQRETVQSRDVTPIVATLRTEPESFNRLVTASSAVDVITNLIHAPLVKVDRQTGALMPWLAERWEQVDAGIEAGPEADAEAKASAYQPAYRLHLRPGLRFSDGTPFTSADVVFTFRALYDERVNSALASGLRVDGLPLTVTAENDLTVRVEFPAPYGPGLAMLDPLPILPRHRLEQALAEGRLAEAWAASAPPESIVGLGPFVVSEVRAGESMTFARNPHYFRRDDQGALPRIDRLIVRVVPDQSAEMVQLESGAADLVTSGLRAEDIAAFQTLEQQGRVRLHRVGIGLDPNALWFNLKAGAPPSIDRPWLQRRELRQAISRAVNRQRMIDTVFLGEAEPVITPVTPGHGAWHAADVRPPAHNLAEAGRLLAALGLEDRNGDGIREDANGREARIAILTQRGHTIRERMTSVIQEDLRRAGIAVDVVPLEVGALIARIGSGDYDAVLFGLQSSAADPALNLDFWLPRGAFHFWNPAQPAPATEWEAALASLMDRVARLSDQQERYSAFHRVQRLFAQELPAIYFAAPRVVFATSARIEGIKPAVTMPHVLWMPDTLLVAGR